MTSKIAVFSGDSCAKTIIKVRIGAKSRLFDHFYDRFRRIITTQNCDFGCHFVITFDGKTVIGAEWFNLADRFASKLSSKITVFASDCCVKT